MNQELTSRSAQCLVSRGTALFTAVSMACSAGVLNAQQLHVFKSYSTGAETFLTGLSGDGTTAVGYFNLNSNASDSYGIAMRVGSIAQRDNPLNGDRAKLFACSYNGNLSAATLHFPTSNPRGYRHLTGYESSGWYPLAQNGPGDWMQPRTISDNGEIAAGYMHRWTAGPNSMWGFRWTPTDGVVVYPAPTGYVDSAILCATPSASHFAGYVTTPTGNKHAIRWTSAGGHRIVGTLPDGQVSDIATGMSSDGTVVVGTSQGPPPYSIRGFRWQDLGGGASAIQDIGVLPGGTVTEAKTCTRDGSVVLGSSVVNGVPRAMFFTQAMGMVDLNTWLPSVGLPSFNGFSVLNQIVGVSEDGTVIAGNGVQGGVRHGFVVTGVPCFHRPTVFTISPDATICQGVSRSITVYAGGQYTNALSYEWLRDGVPLTNQTLPWGSWITGANTDTITIHNAKPEDSGNYQCWVSNPCGGAASDPSSLNVSALPTLDYQPVDTTACLNGLAVIGTQASPGPGTNYQWWRYHQTDRFSFSVPVADGVTTDGTVILGAQSPTLIFSNTKPDVAGVYYCVAARPCGTVTTNYVRLSLNTSAPAVTQHPTDLVSCAAGPAVFTVAASPATNGPYTYQWHREAAPNVFVPIMNGGTTGWGGCGLVSGAQTATLTLAGDPNMLPIDGVRFRCRVTNACGSTWSNPAALTICPGDYNCDGGVDGGDVDAFFDDWQNGLVQADLNCDGGIDNDDVGTFFGHWENGC
ncbi:MAG: immunoglobulin domain-containing protein [Phycisphaerae bacterium]|nr:immunoglobulin domain-containing protein [Phycisphaerae bacterium]